MPQIAASVIRQEGITTAQRDSLTVTSGEFWKIYNETTEQWEYWNGSAWVALDTTGSANLSEGTTTNTTVDVNSSSGTNATLVAASTSRAGVMTKAKFDEVVVNNAKVTELAPISDTGTEIDLSNYVGNFMNMASANSTTTYTTTGQVLGGNAVVLINAASEPVITGATKIKGSDFIISTDMHMVVQYFGTTTQFFFIEL